MITKILKNSTYFKIMEPVNIYKDDFEFSKDFQNQDLRNETRAYFENSPYPQINLINLKMVQKVENQNLNELTLDNLIDIDKHNKILDDNKFLKAFYYKNNDSNLSELSPSYSSNFIEICSFLNSTLIYAKTNYIGQHSDGTKIYSQYSKNFFSKLNLEDVIFQKDKNFSFVQNNQTRNIYLKNIGSTSTINNFFLGNYEADIPTVNTSLSLTNSASNCSSSMSSLSKEDYFSLPENDGKQEFAIFHIPSWESKNLKDPEWKKVSLSFANKRKGVFVPTYLKTKILNEFLQIEEIYMLTMNFLVNEYGVSEDFINKIKNYKNPAKSFNNFLQKYSFENALFFKDKNLYYQRIKTKHLKFNKYINVENALLNAQFENYAEQVSLFIDDAPSFLDDKILSSELIDILSAKPKENLIINKKINKLHLKYQKHKQNFEQIKQKAAQIVPILDYAKIIYNMKLQIKNNPININSSTSNIDTLIQIKDHHNDLLKEKKQYILDSIKTNAFEKDLFLSNLIKENIFLMEISYEDSSKLTSDPNEQIDFDFISNKKISEVTFLINKPVPIFVDSKINPKAIKVGGPYIVKVTKSSIGLKLKDKSSFFGLMDSNAYIKYHPHSATISNSSLSSPEYANCCLGEASALIYSAFSNNCLKTIIMSAMTWVTSANSSDTWGRSYCNFLDYSIIDQTTLTENNEEVTELEVQNFLSIAQDKFEEGIELSFEQNTEDPVPEEIETPQIQNFTTNDFTATPPVYRPYSSTIGEERNL